MLLGAIDIGTNSIHLIVVELDPRFGTSRTLTKAREMVRLGAGDALARGYLGRKAIERGVAAISRFAAEARKAGAAEIRAVATSAVREAKNRGEFVAAVRSACGVTVEVLSELDEARLIHLGVSRGFQLTSAGVCIIDIGGGSTEIIVADESRPYFLHSVKLGSLRLYEEYLRDGKPSGYRAMRKRVTGLLSPLAEQLAEFRFEMVVGTSGTIMGLATLDAARAGTPVARTHGYHLRLDSLRKLQAQMVRMTPEERRKMPGMNPRRSDIIVAGNAILMEALRTLGRDEIVVCERALREGIVVDFLERNVAVARRLGDERTRRFDQVHALGRRFGHDGVHETQVANLALQLFDRLRDLHALEPVDRDALFAAALLHDIGRSISESSHHKHGAYIVRNAVLEGWRADEIELIAALVRYHRRSLPKPTHAEYSAADTTRKRKIGILGGILRIADGLDSRHLGVVGGVEARALGTRLELVATAEQDVTTEVASAIYKSDMLARTLGLPITIRSTETAVESESVAVPAEPDGLATIG
jgi:exopolyphosphatase/guanosine-5'-triphosphate,3'-diphosphate pyrophosphatase